MNDAHLFNFAEQKPGEGESNPSQATVPGFFLLAYLFLYVEKRKPKLWKPRTPKETVKHVCALRSEH